MRYHQQTNNKPDSVQLGSISCLFSLISNIFLALPRPGGSGESRITGGWFSLIKYQYITVIYYLLTKHDIILSDLRNVLHYIFLSLWRQKRKINMWKETWKIEGFHSSTGKRNNSKRHVKIHRLIAKLSIRWKSYILSHLHFLFLYKNVHPVPIMFQGFLQILHIRHDQCVVSMLSLLVSLLIIRNWGIRKKYISGLILEVIGHNTLLGRDELRKVWIKIICM